VVGHACNPSYSGGRDRRISGSRLAQSKLIRPIQKQSVNKRAGVGVAQVIEHLPTSCLRNWVQPLVSQKEKKKKPKLQGKNHIPKLLYRMVLKGSFVNAEEIQPIIPHRLSQSQGTDERQPVHVPTLCDPAPSAG
jgi:hypothetical protein